MSHHRSQMLQRLGALRIDAKAMFSLVEEQYDVELSPLQLDAYERRIRHMQGLLESVSSNFQSLKEIYKS